MGFARRLQFGSSNTQAPSTFTITSVTPGANEIAITWNGYPGATGYRVTRDGVDTWTGDLDANARSWTALYLVDGNTYNPCQAVQWHQSAPQQVPLRCRLLTSMQSLLQRRKSI